MDEVRLQRAYYEATAGSYTGTHVHDNDEHDRALAAFTGLARLGPHASFLDVGAGTGRALRKLKDQFPASRLVGVEPSEALRHAAGELKGIELVNGDATELEYGDDEFDWVIETGVLHHIRNFKRATSEMCRVARFGVMISDSNNLGQGAFLARLSKRIIKFVGLWRVVVLAQTQGKGYKFSDGDGVYYSFCAFDCVNLLRSKFNIIYYMNTQPSGSNLYTTAPHVMIVASSPIRPPV